MPVAIHMMLNPHSHLGYKYWVSLLCLFGTECTEKQNSFPVVTQLKDQALTQINSMYLLTAFYPIQLRKFAHPTQVASGGQVILPIVV